MSVEYLRRPKQRVLTASVVTAAKKTGGHGRKVPSSSEPPIPRLAMLTAVTPFLQVVSDDGTGWALESDWPTLAGAPGAYVNGVDWSPDRTRLAVVVNTTPFLYVIDVASKTVETGWPALTGSTYHAVKFSPDGSLLVVSTNGGTRLYVIDVATKTVDTAWPNWGTFVPYGFSWTADGSRLAAAVTGGTALRVVDAATKTEEAGWPTSHVHGQSVAWNPDATRIAITQTGAAPNLSIVDVATKTVETGWPATGPSGVHWSPDGAWLFSTGTNANRQFSAISTTSKALDTAWPHTTRTHYGLAVRSDGTYVAAGYETASPFYEIIDIATKAAETVPAASGLVRAMAWMPA